MPHLVDSKGCQAGRQAERSGNTAPVFEPAYTRMATGSTLQVCSEHLMAMPQGMLVLDTSIVQPMSQACTAVAAQVTGTAAQAREMQKNDAYRVMWRPRV